MCQRFGAAGTRSCAEPRSLGLLAATPARTEAVESAGARRRAAPQRRAARGPGGPSGRSPPGGPRRPRCDSPPRFGPAPSERDRPPFEAGAEAERRTRDPRSSRRRPTGPELPGCDAALDRAIGRTCGIRGRMGRARARPRRLVRAVPGTSRQPLPPQTRLEIAFDRAPCSGRQVFAGVNRHGRLARPAAHADVRPTRPDHRAVEPQKTPKRLPPGHVRIFSRMCLAK